MGAVSHFHSPTFFLFSHCRTLKPTVRTIGEADLQISDSVIHGRCPTVLVSAFSLYGFTVQAGLFRVLTNGTSSV
jgi:hypothetical protein